jgi:hypothetical protein
MLFCYYFCYKKANKLSSFVEHGKNPDIFTQGFVERAATENQFTNGKIKAVGVSCLFWKFTWTFRFSNFDGFTGISTITF